jgi:hypothetical protein
MDYYNHYQIWNFKVSGHSKIQTNYKLLSKTKFRLKMEPNLLILSVRLLLIMLESLLKLKVKALTKLRDIRLLTLVVVLFKH